MAQQDFTEVTKNMVRNAVQALGDAGQTVSYGQIYEALGLSTENQQAVVRTRLSDMLRHGEVTRIKAGCFTYNTAHRPREGKTYVSMWRFVRKSKPGWDLSECAMLLRISYTQVLRYVAWLEDEGYVEKAGRNERRAFMYRATAKASTTPETPYPQQREVDPFQKERVAAATITRLMLCADPYAAKTARTITEAARVLLARFDTVTPVTPFTEDENTEENTHAE